jgi:hypothetical protein
MNSPQRRGTTEEREGLSTLTASLFIDPPTSFRSQAKEKTKREIQPVNPSHSRGGNSRLRVAEVPYSNKKIGKFGNGKII